MFEMDEQVIKKVEAGVRGKLEQLALEERYRADVFSAISKLSDDLVDEDTLLKTLPLMDKSSWMEVVEERYLGRTCGFPLCKNSVAIKKEQRYRIDLKRKKIYERSAEADKFCSEKCFERSVAVKEMLEVEPLWMRGEDSSTSYDLETLHKAFTAKNMPNDEDSERNNVIQYVEDNLVTALSNLKVGDTADSDDECNDEEHENDCDEDRDFHPVPCVSKASLTDAQKPITKENLGPKVQEVRMPEGDVAEEKLERIRSKYKTKKVLRPPIMIEAKPLKPIKDTIHVEQVFTDTANMFREWCGKVTIAYLRLNGNVEVDLISNGEMTDAELLLRKFYAGDRPIDDSLKTISLPPVDNIEVMRQRLYVLQGMLKPGWHLLEPKIGLAGCHQRSIKLLSTFNLTADNLCMGKKAAVFAVALILRLLAHCDKTLLDDHFTTDNHPKEKLASLLQSIGCDVDFFKCTVEDVLKLVKENDQC